MAECELSVLEKQCLGERVGDEPTLRADRPVECRSEPSIKEDRLAVPNHRRENQAASTLPADYDGLEH